MKKLTKRVQAGGLWFDVAENADYISTDNHGMVKSHTSEPRVLRSSETWMSKGYDDFVCYFDLEGADWRECCWYVGDQVEGEAVERREWMARGVDLFMDQFVCRGGLPARVFADKIRAGEIG